MARGWKQRESVAHGARRLWREKLAVVREAARRGSRSSVHEVRRELKEMRALLRLLRRALGNRVYREANAALRDLASPLSKARDLEASDGAMGPLASDARGQVAADVLRGAKSSLRAALHKAESKRGGLLRALDEPLARLENALGNKRLRGAGWKTIASGLARTQSSARAAMKAALKGRGDLALHEWRKQVKYLRGELRVLRACAPKALDVRLETLNHISDLLGTDRDLAVLAERLAAMPARASEQQRLHALITSQRLAMQREAVVLGKKYFSESPHALVHTLHRQWRAWRRRRDPT